MIEIILRLKCACSCEPYMDEERQKSSNKSADMIGLGQCPLSLHEQLQLHAFTLHVSWHLAIIRMNTNFIFKITFQPMFCIRQIKGSKRQKVPFKAHCSVNPVCQARFYNVLKPTLYLHIRSYLYHFQWKICKLMSLKGWWMRMVV